MKCIQGIRDPDGRWHSLQGWDVTERFRLAALRRILLRRWMAPFYKTWARKRLSSSHHGGVTPVRP